MASEARREVGRRSVPELELHCRNSVTPVSGPAICAPQRNECGNCTCDIGSPSASLSPSELVRECRMTHRIGHRGSARERRGLGGVADGVTLRGSSWPKPCRRTVRWGPGSVRGRSLDLDVSRWSKACFNLKVVLLTHRSRNKLAISKTPETRPREVSILLLASRLVVASPQEDATVTPIHLVSWMSSPESLRCTAHTAAGSCQRMRCSARRVECEPVKEHSARLAASQCLWIPSSALSVASS
jgi:hypothetical protein